MKQIDMKQLKDLASQVPDIISKGKQILDAAKNVMSTVQNLGKTDEKKENSKKDELLLVAETEVTVEDHTEIPPAVPAENKLNKKSELTETLTKTISTPLAVTQTINELIKQAGETIRFCNEQETVRTEIRARSEVERRKIDAMADMVRDYLNKSFDERAGLFDNYFSVLDKALENGDNILVAQTLQSINSLAESSPFKDLADLDKVSAMLTDGAEWDI